MHIPHISTALFLALIHPSRTLAQSTPLSNTTCGSPSYTLSAPVNASNRAPIARSPQNWFITTTLNDTRSASTADHQLWGFLSTPRNSTGSVCAYLLNTLLEPQLDGIAGCRGSLSDRCVEFLRSSILLGPEHVRAGRCPGLPSSAEMVRECGDPLGSGFTGGIAGPIDLSNTTCTDSRLPGRSQSPEHYVDRALLGVSGFGDERSDSADPTQFTWYDRYVTQPLPWVFAEQSNGESRTRVVCVNPRDVADGSRNPWTSAGGQVRGNWVGVGVGLGFTVLALW